MISGVAAEASRSAQFEVSEMGLALSIEVANLIEGIHLSPKATDTFERDVRAHLARLGFPSTRVVKSEMAGAPI